MLKSFFKEQFGVPFWAFPISMYTHYIHTQTQNTHTSGLGYSEAVIKGGSKIQGQSKQLWKAWSQSVKERELENIAVTDSLFCTHKSRGSKANSQLSKHK